MYIVLAALIGWFFGFKGLAVMILAFAVFVLINAYYDNIRSDSIAKYLAEEKNQPPRKLGGFRL